MAVSNEPAQIRDPVPLGIAAQIDFDIFSDRIKTTRKVITGLSIHGWVKDPAGTWTDYTGVIDTGSTGDAHITLDTSNHATTGTAELRVTVDGELAYPRHQFDFIEEAV